MKIFWKALAIQCAAAVAVCSFPLSAGAAEGAVPGDSDPAAYVDSRETGVAGYKLLWTNAMGIGRVIYGLEGEVEDLVIPSTIGDDVTGGSVDYIRGDAFKELDFLRTVRIEEGPKTAFDAGVCIFKDCKNLESAYLPDSFQLTNINGDTGIFSGCTSLSEVRFPHCPVIPKDTFKECTSLKEFYIPLTVNAIGSEAFAYSGLTEIDIPDGVTTLGQGVFRGCDNLQTVSLGGSLQAIASSMFENCTSLSEIEIPSNITRILYRAFSGCKALKSFTILETVEEIDDLAFYDCESLKSITIPSTVKTMGSSIFSGSGLTQVKLESGLQTLGTDMFTDCGFLTDLTIPGSVAEIPDNFFGRGKNLETVILEDGVKKIGQYAFPYEDRVSEMFRTKFSKIQIPASVTEIDDRAFGDMNYGGKGIPKDLVIHGYTGSYAEEYAAAHNINFVSIGNVNDPPIEPDSPEEPDTPSEPGEGADHLEITSRFPEAGVNYVDSFRTHDIEITFNDAVTNVIGTGKIHIRDARTDEIVASYACDAGMTTETERIQYKNTNHKTVILKGALDELSYEKDYYITIDEKTFTFEDSIHTYVRWLPAIQDKSWTFKLFKSEMYPGDDESDENEDQDEDGSEDTLDTAKAPSRSDTSRLASAIRRIRSGKKLLSEYDEAEHYFNKPNISGKAAQEAYTLAMIEYMKVTDTASMQYAVEKANKRFEQHLNSSLSVNELLENLIVEMDIDGVATTAIDMIGKAGNLTKSSSAFETVKQYYTTYSTVSIKFDTLVALLEQSEQTSQARNLLIEACWNAKAEMQKQILKDMNENFIQQGISQLAKKALAPAEALLKPVSNRIMNVADAIFAKPKNDKAAAGLMHLLDNLDIAEEHIGNIIVESKQGKRVPLYEDLFNAKRNVKLALYSVAIQNRNIANGVGKLNQNAYMGDLKEQRDALERLTYDKYVK